MSRWLALALVTAASLLAAPMAGSRAQASVSRCVMADVSVRLAEGVSPSTGAHPIAFRIVNRGHAACTLYGYPLVALRDSRGVIPFVYRHGGESMVTPRHPRRVLLRPGGSAYVLLDKFRCDLGARRVGTSAQVWLEGSARRGREITLRGYGIALCKPGIPAEGRVVTVSPFEPTLRATLR